MRKIVYILVMAIGLACTENPAEPETGVTLNGTVQLEGSQQLSDTNVYLYTLPDTDSLVYKYIEQYPVLGLDANPLMSFDHRQYEPAHHTTCDEEGNYRLVEVEEGIDYVLVAAKPGFGWQYHYLPAAAKGIEIPDLKLYPETRVQSLSGGYQIWEKDRHYIVENSVTLPASGVLFIDKGVTVRFTGPYGITVNGTLEMNGDRDDYITFRSNSPFTNWTGIRFFNSNDILISFTNFSSAREALKFSNCSNISISNSIFQNNIDQALLLSQTENSEINSNVFLNNPRSCYLAESNSLDITGNIFLNSSENAIVLESSNPHIASNLFVNNERGIFYLYRPGGTTVHNDFFSNSLAIFCAGSDPLIQANNFDENPVSIHIGVEFAAINAQPQIHYNNFYNNQFAIKLTGGKSGPNKENIHAENNFWGTISEGMIRQLIYDKNDISNTLEYVGEIIYTPFEETIIDTAGIIY